MKKIFSIFFIILLMIYSLFINNMTILKASATENSYNITAGVKGSGYVKVNKYSVIKNSEELITYSAYPKNGFHFVGWILEGQYEIIKGSLMTPVIEIKVKSDIVGIATFNDGEYKETIININLPDTTLSAYQDTNWIFLLTMGIIILFCLITFCILVF